MPRKDHRPTARDIAVARSLRSLFEHSIPKDFFSDDPDQIVYGDPQIVNAYDFCMMIQEQTKCTFRAASKAAARVLVENGDDSPGWAECWIDEGDGPDSNSPDTAPIIGGTDGRDFRCRACLRLDDFPVHGDSDPDCHPPTCKECGAVMVPEGVLAPDPLLYAILRADLPSVRNPDLRKERRTVWAKAIRRLLADLGIKGVSITTPHYSMAHSIDVKLPAGTEHDRGAADHEYRDCPMCQERNRAQDRITQIILAAFPDLDDRSDSMTDYFDFCLSVD